MCSTYIPDAKVETAEVVTNVPSSTDISSNLESARDKLILTELVSIGIFYF